MKSKDTSNTETGGITETNLTKAKEIDMSKASDAQDLKDAQTHKIIDPGLFACLSVLHTHKDSESNIKKSIKSLDEGMREGIQRYIDEYGTPLTLEILSVDPNGPVYGPGTPPKPEIRTVTITPGETKTLDKKKLLDAGVHPDIINSCTTVTSSQTVKVT